MLRDPRAPVPWPALRVVFRGASSWCNSHPRRDSGPAALTLVPGPARRGAAGDFEGYLVRRCLARKAQAVRLPRPPARVVDSAHVRLGNFPGIWDITSWQAVLGDADTRGTTATSPGGVIPQWSSLGPQPLEHYADHPAGRPKPLGRRAGADKVDTVTGVRPVNVSRAMRLSARDHPRATGLDATRRCMSRAGRRGDDQPATHCATLRRRRWQLRTMCRKPASIASDIALPGDARLVVADHGQVDRAVTEAGSRPILGAVAVQQSAAADGIAAGMLSHRSACSAATRSTGAEPARSSRISSCSGCWRLGCRTLGELDVGALGHRFGLVHHRPRACSAEFVHGVGGAVEGQAVCLVLRAGPAGGQVVSGLQARAQSRASAARTARSAQSGLGRAT